MVKLPLVSILIPVFNREELVITALESALSQTYPNYEIILVDNCSTDKTFEVIREYARNDPRVRAFHNEENIGPVRNWKRCAEHSRGEFVKILFSDDWLEPDALERLVEPLLKHADVGFSYSAVDIHHADGTVSRAYQLVDDRLLSSFEFLKAQVAGLFPVPVSPGCAMFKREDVIEGLIEHIPNKFDLKCDQIGMGNDLMLFLRTCAKYPYVFYVSDRLSHFRAHQSSFTIRISRSMPDMSRICHNNARAYFLATVPLEARKRRILKTLLLFRILKSGLGQVNGSRFEQYKRLFPDEHRCYEFDLGAIPVLVQRFLKRLG